MLRSLLPLPSHLHTLDLVMHCDESVVAERNSPALMHALEDLRQRIISNTPTIEHITVELTDKNLPGWPDLDQADSVYSSEPTSTDPDSYFFWGDSSPYGSEYDDDPYGSDPDYDSDCDRRWAD